MLDHPFQDSFGIGSVAVARVQRETSSRELLRAAQDILCTSYVPPEWLAMRVRQYADNRPAYDTANSILEATHG